MSLSVNDITRIINASRKELGIDQFGRKKCKHMREDGFCLKGASSSGRCMMYCSHYETKQKMEDLMNEHVYKQNIMRDNTLSDMQKLQKVFNVSKEKLKANDPYLYYAILAVLDANKKNDPGTYFESEV